MIAEKLTPAAVGTAQLTTSRRLPSNVVHDLKNCMSILLLNVGNLKADADCMGGDKHLLETLQTMIHKMNCLVEELAQLLGEQDQSQTTRKGSPPQKAARDQNQVMLKNRSGKDSTHS
jgi:hypothetical protein